MNDDARALLAPLRSIRADVAAIPVSPLISIGRRRLVRRRVARLSGAVAFMAATVFTVAGVAGSDGHLVTRVSPAAAPAQGTVLPQPDPDAPIILGATYRYRLYGHCGVDWIKLGGRYWRAETPLSEAVVPTHIFGTMFVTPGGRSAVFRDGAGTEILFVPVQGEPDWGCA